MPEDENVAFDDEAFPPPPPPPPPPPASPPPFRPPTPPPAQMEFEANVHIGPLPVIPLPDPVNHQPEQQDDFRFQFGR